MCAFSFLIRYVWYMIRGICASVRVCDCVCFKYYNFHDEEIRNLYYGPFYVNMYTWKTTNLNGNSSGGHPFQGHQWRELEPESESEPKSEPKHIINCSSKWLRKAICCASIWMSYYIRECSLFAVQRSVFSFEKFTSLFAVYKYWLKNRIEYETGDRTMKNKADTFNTQTLKKKYHEAEPSQIAPVSLRGSHNILNIFL